MGILLGFAPFIVFALLTGLSVSLALWLAFAVAFAIGIRDFLHAKMIRMLDITCLMLFAMLAIYTGFIQPSLPVQAVRMIADVVLLLLALISMARKIPFTEQYVRDEMPERFWDTPAFARASYVLSGVWAAAFLVMAVADGLTTFAHHLPFSLDVAIGLAALAAAIVFTVRYPVHPLAPR
ncbi:MAG TPA: hypothetical protein VGH02_05850 [Rhizomicrobium sp.]|jgi:hypothetical protein